MLPVQEQIDIAEIRRRATVDDHLVEHQNIGRRRVAERQAPIAAVLLLRVLAAVLPVLPNDRAPQSAAQRQRSVTLQYVRHLLLEVVELEWCQEAERAEVEGHHGRHGLLEQQRRVQQGAVAAETDDEIDAIGKVVAAVSINGRVK